MNKIKSVLVTSIGSVAGDVVITNLKRIGYRVIGCNVYPKEWNAEGLLVDVFYRVPYANIEDKYVDVIEKICVDEGVQYILPLTDVEVDVLNNNRGRFDDLGVEICISSPQTIKIVRNKKVLADFIQKKCSDICVIPTYTVDEICNGIVEYPMIAKPVNGRSSQGKIMITNDKEWDDFVRMPHDYEYIVQPFIGGSVVVVDIVRQPMRNETVVIAREELLRTQHGCGTTVRVFGDSKLEKICKELAEKLDIKGCVNFEFIKDIENKYYFMECNPRFSAGVEFSCMTGYDCVSNHMHVFKKENIEKYELVKTFIIARKYKEYITHVEDICEEIDK